MHGPKNKILNCIFLGGTVCCVFGNLAQNNAENELAALMIKIAFYATRN